MGKKEVVVNASAIRWSNNRSGSKFHAIVRQMKALKTGEAFEVDCRPTSIRSMVYYINCWIGSTEFSVRTSGDGKTYIVRNTETK